ncbi:MAG: hypothetical protein KGL39_13375 [Patescibacteria group bacterium]|nr:hypothetical protein [Patescibacteria group bacterium]
MAAILKIQKWTVTKNGQQKTIGVVATDTPDSIGGGTGGNYAGNWADNVYSPGQIVRNLFGQITMRGVVYNIQPGTYGCVIGTVQSANGGWNPNMLPQYPEPTSGAVYWHLLTPGLLSVNVCSSGQKQIYIATTGQF